MLRFNKKLSYVYNSLGLSVLISINVIFNLRIPLTRCFIKRGKRGESILCKKILYCLINDPPPPPSRFSGDPRVLGLACEYSPLSTFLAPRDVSFLFSKTSLAARRDGSIRRLWRHRQTDKPNMKSRVRIKVGTL